MQTQVKLRQPEQTATDVGRGLCALLNPDYVACMTMNDRFARNQ
jgi:hypothetical protein